MNTHKLYKFRSVNTHNLTALANNHFWFSSIGDFNDPFEGAYIIDNDLSNKDKELLKKAIQKKPQFTDTDSEKYAEALKHLKIDIKNHSVEDLNLTIVKYKLQLLIDIIHNTKCISMSQKNDSIDPIYENLLWSHYSDGLRGFCLVFDKDALSNSFYSSEDDAIRSIKVRYQNRPNKLKLSEFIRSKIFIGEKDNSYIQEVTETIATKSRSWLYENEIRFISMGNQNLYSYKGEDLIEIVIGEKMPTSQKKLVTDISKSVNPGIAIKKACIKQKSYDIEIIDY